MMQIESAPPPVDAARTEPPEVLLVVDDDDIDQRQIRRLLERQQPGLRIESAYDAVTAERVLATGEVTAVLLDLLLPGSDGLEVLARWVAQGCDVPIVILTGQGSQASAVQAMKSGAADYLVKGALDGQRLLTSLRNAMARQRAERERREAVAALERSTRANRSLLACAQTLLLDLLPSRTLETALAGLARQLEAAGLTLWVHAAGRRLPAYRRRAGCGCSERRPERIAFEPYLVRWHLALSCGESLLIDCRELGDRELAAMAVDPADQLALVPFYLGGRWAGALMAERTGPGAAPFTAEQQFFLQGAGDMLTAWLDRIERDGSSGDDGGGR